MPEIQGGPGQNTPAPAATPVTAAPTVSVNLSGIKYEVPAAVAAAWQQERDRINGQFGSRLQQLERRLAEVEQEDEPPVAATPQGPPAPKATDLIENPEKYHTESQAYQRWLVGQAAASLEQRRLEERRIEGEQQALDAEWQGHVAKFFKEYPELKDEADIVDTVWRANFARLKSLEPHEGLPELAKLTKERLVRATETGKRIKAPSLESSAVSRTPRVTKEDDVDEPVRGGLSAIIKEKQRRFKNPNIGAPARA